LYKFPALKLKGPSENGDMKGRGKISSQIAPSAFLLHRRAAVSLPPLSPSPELSSTTRRRGRRLAAMKVSIKTLKGSTFEINVDPSTKVRHAAAAAALLSLICV
jgi:hypothetical protein